MKKVIIIAALAIASFANAQKGSILVAGEVGFGSTSKFEDLNTGVSNYSTSTFAFAPRVGYQFSDNMTVGLDLGFGNATRQSTSTSSELKMDKTRIGAFLRYAKSLGGAFSLYGDLAIGSQSTKFSSNAPGSTSTKYTGMYLGITPSVAIDLKKGFWLNFSFGGLNYESQKGDWTNAENGSSFGLTLGQQMNIGVSKNF